MELLTLAKENWLFIAIGVVVALIVIGIIIKVVKSLFWKVISIIVILNLGIGGGLLGAAQSTIAEYGDQAKDLGISVVELLKTKN